MLGPTGYMIVVYTEKSKEKTRKIRTAGEEKIIWK
jgi:hypothetical protein